MTAIEVLDGALLSTVQDLGRFGAQQYGVPVSGAMDVWALRAANRLVGNDEGAAALEITLAGPVLRFDRPGVIAVTGADLGACLDGQPMPSWQAVGVAAGSELSFSGVRDGLRAYLGVGGGIDVPLVLGSRSTLLTARLGPSGVTEIPPSSSHCPLREPRVTLESQPTPNSTPADNWVLRVSSLRAMRSR